MLTDVVFDVEAAVFGHLENVEGFLEFRVNRKRHFLQRVCLLAAEASSLGMQMRELQEIVEYLLYRNNMCSLKASVA